MQSRLRPTVVIIWAGKRQPRSWYYLWSEVDVRNASFSEARVAATMCVPVWMCYLCLLWPTGKCRAGVREQLFGEPRLPGPGGGSPTERGAVLAGSSAFPRTVSGSFPRQLHYICFFQWPRSQLVFSLVWRDIWRLECGYIMHAQCKHKL